MNSAGLDLLDIEGRRSEASRSESWEPAFQYFVTGIAVLHAPEQNSAVAKSKCWATCLEIVQPSAFRLALALMLAALAFVDWLD